MCSTRGAYTTYFLVPFERDSLVSEAQFSFALKIDKESKKSLTR